MQTQTASANPRRTTHRARVLKNADLFTQSGLKRVRVRDLTKGGARVFAEAELPQDGDVMFKCAATFVAARVAWSKGAEVGLQFYRELTDADLTKIVPLWLLREQQPTGEEPCPAEGSTADGG